MQQNDIWSKLSGFIYFISRKYMRRPRLRGCRHACWFVGGKVSLCIADMTHVYKYDLNLRIACEPVITCACCKLYGKWALWFVRLRSIMYFYPIGKNVYEIVSRLNPIINNLQCNWVLVKINHNHLYLSSIFIKCNITATWCKVNIIMYVILSNYSAISNA